jgi:hypothetical protein
VLLLFSDRLTFSGQVYATKNDNPFRFCKPTQFSASSYDMNPQSSFTDNKRPVADAALKNLILNEPQSAVSKLRDLATAPSSKSERIAFLSHLVDLFSPRQWDEISTMCWNSLLEAKLPQLIIEILCEELKNTESVSTTKAPFSSSLYTLFQGKMHIHLACTLSAASQYFKTAMIRDCKRCLSIFIDQANPIVEAIWPYRRDLEADATTWTALGQLFSLLGREIAKSQYALTSLRLSCSHPLLFVVLQWRSSYLQCRKASQCPGV